MSNPRASIYIDPSYPIFNDDKLFDLSDPLLNRDDQLLPFHRLREDLRLMGRSIHTADMLPSEDADVDPAYISLGISDKFRQILLGKKATLKAFVIMEPPVVAPHLYEMLPELTDAFERVFIHNVVGDGYGLKGVRREKLRRLYWPLPYDTILEPYWGQRDRANRVVVINGSHKPQVSLGEQYSTRIDAMVALARLGVVDLYGRGWDRWWSREAMWLPYWRNRRTLMSIYKGVCVSKYEILQRYKFCLCFENMEMQGYITEKLFDCLYAGTIPLYLGAPDIERYVPPDVFIDCKRYQSWDDMWSQVSKLPAARIQEMRDAGRQFLASEGAKPFFGSLRNIVLECDA